MRQLETARFGHGGAGDFHPAGRAEAHREAGGRLPGIGGLGPDCNGQIGGLGRGIGQHAAGRVGGVVEDEFITHLAGEAGGGGHPQPHALAGRRVALPANPGQGIAGPHHPAIAGIGGVVEAAFGLGDAHTLQPVDGLGAGRIAAQGGVGLDGLAHLLAHGQHRVQAGHRLLEDHAGHAAAQPVQRGLVGGQHLGAIQPDAAAGVGVGVVKAGQAFVSLGTSGVLFAANDGYQPDPATAVHRVLFGAFPSHAASPLAPTPRDRVDELAAVGTDELHPRGRAQPGQRRRNCHVLHRGRGCRRRPR